MSIHAATGAQNAAFPDFPGAIVVVVHDRFFSEKVANRRILFGVDGAGPVELEVRAM